MAQPLGDARVDVRVGHRLVELRDRGAVERRVELEMGERRDVLGARHRAVSVSAGLPAPRPAHRRPPSTRSQAPRSGGGPRGGRRPVRSGKAGWASHRQRSATDVPRRGRRPALPAGRPDANRPCAARRRGPWGNHGFPHVEVPGLGVEPRCPVGTAGFKPAASDQFRHPGGGCHAEASYGRAGSVSGGKRSGPLNWYASKKALKAASSNGRALREVRGPFGRIVARHPGAERDLVAERRIRREDRPPWVLCVNSRSCWTVACGTSSPYWTAIAPCSRLWTSCAWLTGSS